MEHPGHAHHGQDRGTWLTAAVLVALVLSVAFWLLNREMHPEDPRVVAGKADFARYCAECHGAEGRGDGPMAGRLDPRPANLRLIARRNGGVFRPEDLRTFIDGGAAERAHGPRTMPAWGGIFEATAEPGRDPKDVVGERIARITAYVFTIQD